MTVASLLFPEQKRDFPSKRWVKISLRTLHLLGIAGFAGAFIQSVDPGLWKPFVALTLVSGLAMVAVELWTHGIWLLQVRGQAVIIKLLLLALTLYTDKTADLILLGVIIVISGLVSHAPGNVRYYSVFYQRRITSDTWQWKGKKSVQSTEKMK